MAFLHPSMAHPRESCVKISYDRKADIACFRFHEKTGTVVEQDPTGWNLYRAFLEIRLLETEENSFMSEQ